MIYTHLLRGERDMGIREKAKLARILHRAAAILVGSIFGLITGAGIAAWMELFDAMVV
jgi:predicted DNA-binding transcriptional regulator